jgi:hypothetical protein
MKGLILLAGVVACSGGDDGIDMTGTYMVTTDVESMPCGTDQPRMMPPAYLKFHKDNFFGVTLWAYDECNDAAATDCPGFGDSYEIPKSNGWDGDEKFSSNGGSASTTCSLGYIQSSARLVSGALTLEHTEYEDTVMLPDAQCTTDEAGKRGTSMPCTQHFHIEATKL